MNRGGDEGQQPPAGDDGWLGRQGDARQGSDVSSGNRDFTPLGAAHDAPAVEATGIGKAFGPVQANRNASLIVQPGEIHALVGENGAGKSTLMKILAGLFPPDEGTVRISGRDVTGWSAAAAIRAGVGMVHQHFMLIPRLTVAENVVLGHELMRGVVLDRERAEREVRELGTRTGLEVDPSRMVGELSVGEAQRVEIVKVLFRGARVLILDEPTAVLSPPEVTELWSVLRRLRDDGATIVLITHKLDEVMEVSDAITVMRGGQTVDTLRTTATSPAAIARAMVGRDVTLHADRARESIALAGTASGQAAAAGTVARAMLEVRDLRIATTRQARAVDGVTFDVGAGEILGVAGVEGNGQTELIEAIAGLRAPVAGSIRVDGRDVTGLAVRDRADGGLSHIPEDRHRRGLVLDYSLADNLILGLQHRYARGAGLDRRAVLENARKQIERFDVRPADPELPARSLSGGNQQKVVIAREMGRDFHVLLAAQPTRGVDVGAIEFIHDQLRQARASGKAVLLVSADLSEVLALSDRVAVMYGGRIVAILSRDEATAERIGGLMTGAGTAPAGAAA